MASPPKMPANEYQGDRLISIAIAFIVLDIVFVALRIWSRRLQQTKFRLDEVFVLIGLVFIIGTCANCICAVLLGGVGRHIIYIPKHQRIRWLKTTYIAAPCLYYLATSPPKLAVICMYLNIFPDRLSRWCCYILAIIITGAPLLVVPLAAKQCTPINYLWDKSIQGGHCIDQREMFRFGGIPNIVTDVCILVLPMPLLWKLQVSLKIKIGLFLTFLLGNVGLITSILRLVDFFQPYTDGTWATVPLLGWAIIEPSTYLIAACLLAYRPLFRHLINDIKLSRLFTRFRSGVRVQGYSGSQEAISRVSREQVRSDKSSPQTIELNDTTLFRTDEESESGSLPNMARGQL